MRLIRVTAGAVLLLACASCADTMRTNPPASSPGGTTAQPEPGQVVGSERGVIPVGQEIDVRLQTALSSATATTEQRFDATTAADLMQGSEVLIPAGSVVRGVVSSVEPAGRVDRSGRLTLAFDQIAVKGREHRIRGMATQVFESRGIRDEGRTVGAAGAVGAIVGGILGGLKGALIGAAVGSGGVIAATEGKDIELPPGTIIRVRLDQPLRLR